MHAFPQPLGQPAPIAMVVLGDSLAYGLGASCAEAGLVARMHALVRARAASTLHNFSVPHSTMGDVLRHQVPKLHGMRADLVVVIAGANDLRYTRDVLVLTRRFRALLEAVRRAAPDAELVAGGMPDVTQTVAVPWILKGPISRLCARLNDRMQQIATAAGAGFIDLFTFTNAPLCLGEAYLCDDGFHPNDFGYAEIAQRSFPPVDAALERIIASAAQEALP
jgi:lysophospholipase L1-like esterase